ncbi:MAG: hypothetical protein K0R66_929 [Gammaproteobacteria bacterium]|jgi:hypothetical protein|nr:hypothetical protein [Gammaproteobacteria bacterium]
MHQSPKTVHIPSPWLLRYSGLVELWARFYDEQLTLMSLEEKAKIEQTIRERFAGLADKRHFKAKLDGYQQEVKTFKGPTNPDIEKKRDLLLWADIHYKLRNLPYCLTVSDSQILEVIQVLATAIPRYSSLYHEAKKIESDMEILLLAVKAVERAKEADKQAVKLDFLLDWDLQSESDKQATKKRLTEILSLPPEGPAELKGARLARFGSVAERPKPSLEESINAAPQTAPRRMGSMPITRPQASPVPAARSAPYATATPAPAPTAAPAPKPETAPAATPAPAPRAEAPAAGGAGRPATSHDIPRAEEPEEYEDRAVNPTYAIFLKLRLPLLPPASIKTAQEAYTRKEIHTFLNSDEARSDTDLDKMRIGLNEFHKAHRLLEVPFPTKTTDLRMLLESIAKSYRTKAKTAHSDKGGGNFTELTNANTILKEYYKKILEEPDLAKMDIHKEKEANILSSHSEPESPNEAYRRMKAIQRAEEILGRGDKETLRQRYLAEKPKYLKSPEELQILRAAYLALKYCDDFDTGRMANLETREKIVKKLIPDELKLQLPDLPPIAQTAVYVPPPPPPVLFLSPQAARRADAGVPSPAPAH